MDAFVAFRQNGLDPQQKSSLGRPVAGTAGAVFLARDDQQGRPFLLIPHAGLENTHGLAGFNAAGFGRQIHRDAPFGAGHKLVSQPDVGKRAPHHDFVIAPSRPKGVEVTGFDALRDQMAAGRAAGRDGTGGRDVIRGHGIPQQRQYERAADSGNRRHLGGQVGEERRLLNVRRGGIPGVQFSFRNGEPGPGLAALEDAVVGGLKQLRTQCLLHGGTDLVLRRPDVAQIDGISEGAIAQGVRVRIEIHGAGQRIGDNQRRRGQEIGLGGGVNASFKVTVTAQHGRGHQVVFRDGVADALQNGTAVSDAGGAAVADGVESQGLQVRRQAGGLQVPCNDSRTRRQAGLDVCRHPKPMLHRLLRQQAGADHD